MNYRLGDHCYLIENNKVVRYVIFNLGLKSSSYYTLISEYGNEINMRKSDFANQIKFKPDALKKLMFDLEYRLGETYTELMILETKYKINGTTEKV